jgi:hypothetical protein
MQAWQSSVIQALCAARQQQFEAAKAAARAELDSLVTQQAELPTLVLRKDERIEVMRGVARQLVNPTGIKLAEAPAEIVRFVHEAIEWESMTYFLYPYFWQKIDRPLEIDHPDMLRRDFLRAGWARVLVPVRAGFEQKIMSYVYTGSVGALAPATMRSVAEQVRDEATQRFDLVASNEGGSTGNFEVISTWYEYTPTDGVYISCTRGVDDIAEPALADEMLDAHAHRTGENAALEATAALRRELAGRAQNLPADAEITLIRDGDGDRVVVGVARGG